MEGAESAFPGLERADRKSASGRVNSRHLHRRKNSRKGVFSLGRWRELNGKALRSTSETLRMSISRGAMEGAESAFPGLERADRKSASGRSTPATSIEEKTPERSIRIDDAVAPPKGGHDNPFHPANGA